VGFAWASLLIDRYGVVTREMLGGEPEAPPWSDIAEAFRTLEARGDIRRGFFLSGLSGVQYASPEAVEALRRQSRDGAPSGSRSGKPSLMSLMDPACPFGTIYPVPGPMGSRLSISHVAGSYLALWDGQPVLAVEGSGRVLSPLVSLGPEDLRETLRSLAVLVRRGGPAGDRARRRITVER
jgi:ATP-dependent Lhr-like helicase